MNFPSARNASRSLPSRLRTIGIEWGRVDFYRWIPKGSRWLAGYLDGRGIPVRTEEFAGGHELQADRVERVILPYFRSSLSF